MHALLSLPLALAFLSEAPANRLAKESSPYLLLHAGNPVDWYPWGDEAIEKARQDQKIIFLSIGYSTCYWCHVMEREVFSNPEIAGLMNEAFVNVKVDREERPDLDEIYMMATQLITRGGGWPNSLFLTPELKPFFAGTYIPPQDRGGRLGFPNLVKRVQDVWNQRRDEVLKQAEVVAEAMKSTLADRRAGAQDVPPPSAVARVVSELKKTFDGTHGGFGGAPKFPSPSNLFLLWELSREGDAEAGKMVRETLAQMGRGAIYDQVGGGFHRYTLDAEWRVPHFEKMLYDNAQLGELLALVGATDAGLLRLARGTLDFVLGEMTLEEGAFKSAIDAETEGEEGAYYVWTAAELKEALGSDGFQRLSPVFGWDGPPNFGGDKYTLYLKNPIGSVSDLEKLRVARGKRSYPRVDDKTLTDWSGMMISAMARTGALMNEPRYMRAAERGASFVLEKHRSQDGILLHASRGGEAKIPAFLDDYAFFIRGLLTLYEVTGAPRWLAEARRLDAEMESRLRDPLGGYTLSGARPHLLFQPKTVTDGAIPSGNAVAILNQIALADLTFNREYLDRASAGLRAFAVELEQVPTAVPTLALALHRYDRRRATLDTLGTSAHVKDSPVLAFGALGALAREVVRAEARFAAEPTADGWRRFELRLAIREGWHVNANPASSKFLVPTEIEKARRARYPPGRVAKLGFTDEPLSVYAGEVTLGGEIPQGERALTVTYQACDELRCLPPVTKRVPLP